MEENDRILLLVQIFQRNDLSKKTVEFLPCNELGSWISSQNVIFCMACFQLSLDGKKVLVIFD